MGLFSRKPEVLLPDPTRTTWSVQMAGTCSNRHKVEATCSISARNGALGQYACSGTCACGADVALTGWVG